MFGFNFGFSGSVQFKTLLKTGLNRHFKFCINFKPSFDLKL